MASDNMDNAIDKQQDTTAIRHHQRCSDLLNHDSHQAHSYYAALELRQCIERLCFEYLALVVYNKRPLSKKERNLYKKEPNFDKMVDFINVKLELNGAKDRMKHPEKDWLIETHGKLGDYLHLTREPRTEEELSEFKCFLRESWERVSKEVNGFRGSITNLTDTAQSIFDKYIKGEITKAEMKRMLDLSDIPRHMLNPK